jgi:hypothetical protein
MNLNSSLHLAVQVGDRELLGSGVVHLEGDESITFNVASLKIVFEFRTDEGAVRYAGSVKEGTLYFELFNHKNVLGEGILKPVEIAQVGGRALSVTYYVSTVNADTSARRFEFAVYVGSTK